VEICPVSGLANVNPLCYRERNNVNHIRTVELLPIKYKTRKHHRTYYLSQSQTSILASQCNHACVILQRTQLQELAICESGGQEQMETKHFEAHLHADSVSPSTALGHPLLSLAQPAVGHSHNPVSSHASVYAAQCGSLSIIKEAHGPAQKNSNKCFLRHCVIKHRTACPQRSVTMTINTSQSTQLLC